MRHEKQAAVFHQERFSRRGRRRAAEVADLEVEQFGVDAPVVVAGARREIFAQRAVAVALGEQHVAARIGDARRELAGLRPP